MALAEETLAQCVKEGKESEWKRVEWDRFVDESTPERKYQTKRTPHYWHVEQESNGTLVCCGCFLCVCL